MSAQREYYTVCTRCNGKSFSTEPIQQCSRCGGPVLITKAHPPWKKEKSVKQMVDDPLFSSATDEWETPQWLFEALDQEFGFERDVCATAENHKCEEFFDRRMNGLEQTWSGICWMNPPYGTDPKTGTDIGDWMKKAVEAANRGATVVCLVPVRSCTRWWHQHAMQGEIRFLRGRLKFGNAKHSAPFPSAIIVMRPANYHVRSVDLRNRNQKQLPGIFD